MLKVRRIKLKNIILNLLSIDDGKLAIHNESNNKMIITDEKVFKYLKEEEVKKNNNPLKSFLHEKSSKSMVDFSLFKLKIEIENLKKFFPIFRYLTSNKSVILAVLLVVVSIIYNHFFSVANTEMINITDFNIIFFYLFSQLFISMVHEISHLYVYQSEINMKTVNIGFSLRYLFIPLFFITVPFMNFFNKNKKLYLMSAGIKSQIVLLGIGCFLSILINNVYIYVFNLVNINLLLINSIPFLKMDGYWMISTILSTDDYMKEYFSFFKNKKKVSNKILIIGTINLVIIVLLVSYNLILLVRYLN